VALQIVNLAIHPNKLSCSATAFATDYFRIVDLRCGKDFAAKTAFVVFFHKFPYATFLTMPNLDKVPCSGPCGRSSVGFMPGTYIPAYGSIDDC
jgi:hypothetical protein